MGINNVVQQSIDAISQYINTEELEANFDEFIELTPMQVFLTAMNFSYIIGGVSFNQYFETYTSWLFIPYFCFIPFTKCQEGRLHSSQVFNNSEEIDNLLLSTKKKYEFADVETLDPNIQKLLNIATNPISSNGVIQYASYIDIKAEYYMQQQDYIIDTQFFKVGYPNMLKTVDFCLSTMPYNIPVCFYSERMGGITMPWGSNKLVSVGGKDQYINSTQVYTLNKFQYTVNSDDRKILFDIRIMSSIFGIYNLEPDDSALNTAKTDQINSQASENSIF